MGERIKDGTYPDNCCPDCGEAIPVETEDGEACSNCEHVFWNSSETSDIPVDFRLRNEGSIIQFCPLTETAKNFSRAELGLEGWQWLGNTFNIDHGIAQELISSLEDEGFNCQWE